MKSVEVSSTGIGFLWLLGVVFITLMLLGITEVAEWSWWLVLCPLWGPLALFFGVIAFLFLVAGLLAIFESFWEAK